MARARVFPAATFLFLLLLLTVAAARPGETVETTTAAVAETKRTCSSMSHKYRGICISGANCANICRTEGFRSGYCRLFRRSCVCTKPC